MQIVLDTYGLSVGVRNGCFRFTSKVTNKLIHPSRISDILVTKPCKISSPAILLAAMNEIMITFCSSSGKPEARLWSPRFLNISTLRRNQYSFTSGEKGFHWCREIIALKTELQAANLKSIGNRKTGLKKEAEAAVREIMAITEQIRESADFIPDGYQKIRYLEAQAAIKYWPVVGKSLPSPFDFSHRVKAGATDGFNPCVNYLYGMLRNQVETAVLSVGLDPALGCMHRDGYCMPSLVFDLMEPFRPLVDRILTEAIRSEKLEGTTAAGEDGATHITGTGKKKLIELFNENLNKVFVLNKVKATLKNHFLLETRRLAQLTGT
jgi:CRISPR-associated protein Cas1